MLYAFHWVDTLFLSLRKLLNLFLVQKPTRHYWGTGSATEGKEGAGLSSNLVNGIEDMTARSWEVTSPD